MHPTLVEIGGFKIASFGLVMVVAFLSALLLIKSRAAKFGLTSDNVTDVSFYAIIFGILGARLLFIVQDLPYYITNWRQLITVQFQGLTSFGAFIVGGIAAYVVCRKKKISPIAFLDAAGPAFLLGHAIGRIGCLLNGCCHGKACATAFPFAAYSAENKLLNVPAQLYDSAMNIGVLLVVLAIENRFRKPGFTLGVTLLLHGLTRFVYEFARAGASSTTIGGGSLTEAHFMALAVMIVGGIITMVAFRSKKEVAA